MEDKSNSQTKEAEQTGETTITDMNEKQQTEAAQAPTPAAPAPAEKPKAPAAQETVKDATQQALEQA